MFKKILFSILIITLIPFSRLSAVHYAVGTSGMILLQVEANGEAWYVYPTNGERYFLGRPKDAFEVMKKLSLGAKHDYIINTEVFPERLSGLILLDVENNGEAYYIYPGDRKKYFLSRPRDAFRIMRELGLGITNVDLTKIPLGDIHAKEIIHPPESIILQDVPFTSQAPFGDWSDQRQQDGCEESSALMAMKWVNSETLTPEESLEMILNISDYIQTRYKEYRDVSSADTVEWIFNDYFNYDKVELKYDITISDIVNELKQGNIVMTPHNGQLLHNPYFVPPGPPRHMLIIKGYDTNKQEFITNDPGTKHGENFRYEEAVLYTAIRDYPTGYHEDIPKIEKNMIVISK